MNEQMERGKQTEKQIAALAAMWSEYTWPSLSWVPIAPSLKTMLRDFQESLDREPPPDLMKKAHSSLRLEDIKRYQEAKPKIIKMRGKGWTHEQIGDKLGFHKSTISKYLKKINAGE